MEKSFTPQDLQAAWDEFVKTSIQKRNHRVELLFKKRKIKIDKNVITINFDSEIQLQQLDDVKEDLMYFIRSRVQNKTITLKANLQEQNEKEMMYTSAQKFDSLKEKYPIIDELKKRLGLDFEF